MRTARAEGQGCLRGHHQDDDDTEFGDSANGVLTEVFYDKDDDSVIIAQVNTYVGTVNRTVDAKGNQNAYVEINLEDVKPDGVNGIEKFETEPEFEDDAYILYTYSQTAEAVKSVAAAKLVSGEVTRAENSTTNLDEKKALTIDGTRYTASHNIAGEDIGDISVGENYDVYLDAYGYLIFVEEVDEIGDYALLVDTQDKGNFSSNRALLVFADGTEKVVDTTENYKNGSDKIANGTIVTYRVDEDGAYTLKAVSASKVYTTDTNNTVEFGKADYADGVIDFAMTNDKATITLTAGKDVTSNSSTVFVVYDDTNDEYTVYTGIKNAPTIKAESGKEVEAFAYCKSGKMATVMFIFVQDGSIIEDGTQNGLFLAKNSVSNLIHDKDGDYYEYQAVVNGEVQTVKVDESLGKNLNGLYKSYSTDKYGIITKVNTYASYTNGKSEEYLEGTGLDKVSDDYTVTLDTEDKNETITVADEAKIFYVDEDGNVETSSYRSIAKDTNDKVYAVVKDYLVQTLVIEEVDDKTPELPVQSNDIEVTISGNQVSFTYLDSTSVVDVAESIVNALKEAGYENPSAEVKNDGTIGDIKGTKGGVTISFSKSETAYSDQFDSTADLNNSPLTGATVGGAPNAFFAVNQFVSVGLDQAVDVANSEIAVSGTLSDVSVATDDSTLQAAMKAFSNESTGASKSTFESYYGLTGQKWGFIVVAAQNQARYLLVTEDAGTVKIVHEKGASDVEKVTSMPLTFNAGEYARTFTIDVSNLSF